MSTFYMPDTSAGRFSILFARLKGKRPRPAFPRELQFQTISTCNAKCIFCAHYHSPKEIIHGRMDDALIEKIIEECARHNVKRVSPYLTNEPLMDKRMPDILLNIRKTCGPKVKTRINTNAALLTEDVGEKLIASKLDELRISVNGYSKETYKHSMGLDFGITMRNINTFLEIKKKFGVDKPKVIVTSILTKLIETELESAKAHWASRNVDFYIYPLDNRAGEINVKEIRTESQHACFVRNCDLFLKQAYIVENGDMIMCCNDWKQSVVVGNMARSSIREVWNSPHFKDLIREYYSGNFSNLEICRTCIC